MDYSLPHILVCSVHTPPHVNPGSCHKNTNPSAHAALEAGVILGLSEDSKKAQTLYKYVSALDDSDADPLHVNMGRSRSPPGPSPRRHDGDSGGRSFKVRFDSSPALSKKGGRACGWGFLYCHTVCAGGILGACW